MKEKELYEFLDDARYEISKKLDDYILEIDKAMKRLSEYGRSVAEEPAKNTEVNLKVGDLVAWHPFGLGSDGVFKVTSIGDSEVVINSPELGDYRIALISELKKVEGAEPEEEFEEEIVCKDDESDLYAELKEGDLVECMNGSYDGFIFTYLWMNGEYCEVKNETSKLHYSFLRKDLLKVEKKDVEVGHEKLKPGDYVKCMGGMYAGAVFRIHSTNGDDCEVSEFGSGFRYSFPRHTLKRVRVIENEDPGNDEREIKVGDYVRMRQVKGISRLFTVSEVGIDGNIKAKTVFGSDCEVNYPFIDFYKIGLDEI